MLIRGCYQPIRTLAQIVHLKSQLNVTHPDIPVANNM